MYHRCNERCLLNINLKGRVARFWSRGWTRLTNVSVDVPQEWNRVMSGEAHDCGFCVQPHSNDQDVVE